MRKQIMTVFACAAVLAGMGTESKAMGKQENKKAIVIAAFGTTHEKAIQSIINIEKAAEKEFPGTEVRVAFTSNIIRKIWQKRAKDEKYRAAHKNIPEAIFNVKTPLATIAGLQNEGVKTIVVQPSHVFAGEEFADLCSYIDGLNSIKTLKPKWTPFKALVIGRPALGRPGVEHDYHEDLEKGAEAVAEDVKKAKEAGAALVYMGHGNEYFSTGIYIEFQHVLRKMYKYPKIYVGTVEGFPSLDDVLNALKHAGIKKVILKPFMVVAGDHANNDMAGDDDDSWKSVFEKNGIEVTPVIEGLGMNPEWVKIYIDHLKDAVKDNKLSF